MGYASGSRNRGSQFGIPISPWKISSGAQAMATILPAGRRLLPLCGVSDGRRHVFSKVSLV